MKRTGLVMLAILLLPLSAGFNLDLGGKGTAAIVKLDGQITPSSSSILNPDGITPEQVRSLNRQAFQKNPDAIIYEINSGGGAVVASKEVMREIDRVSIPTVCRIRDIGASGAYLASLGCDRIVADSASLTGSVGVKASYLEFSGLLERYGVDYVNITAGKRKDVGSRFRDLSEEEREVLEEKVEKIHDEFKTIVRERRNLTPAEMERVETGEALLGSEARKLGLVDRLGGRQTAVRVAENMTSSELETEVVTGRSGFNFLSLLTSDIEFPSFSSQAPLRSSFF